MHYPHIQLTYKQNYWNRVETSFSVSFVFVYVPNDPFSISEQTII